MLLSPFKDGQFHFLRGISESQAGRPAVVRNADNYKTPVCIAFSVWLEANAQFPPHLLLLSYPLAATIEQRGESERGFAAFRDVEGEEGWEGNIHIGLSSKDRRPT